MQPSPQLLEQRPPTVASTEAGRKSRAIEAATSFIVCVWVCYMKGNGRVAIAVILSRSSCEDYRVIERVRKRGGTKQIFAGNCWGDDGL